MPSSPPAGKRRWRDRPAEERRRAFRDALLVLRRRIELFASLPIDKLTHLTLQERLDAIGRDAVATTGEQQGKT